MTTRIFLAGVLGAIAMFMWSFVSHDILPLGEAGMNEISNEQQVTAAMQSSMGDKTGLYIFPGTGLGPDASSAEKGAAMKKAEEMMKTGPSGLLVYHATRVFNFPKRLMVEFVTELIEALLAVWLLAQTRIQTFWGRVGFVFMVGVLAAIATHIPYWNWYGFPINYTQAQVLIHLVQFLIVGIVAGLVLGRRQTAATA